MNSSHSAAVGATSTTAQSFWRAVSGTSKWTSRDSLGHHPCRSRRSVKKSAAMAEAAMSADHDKKSGRGRRRKPAAENPRPVTRTVNTASNARSHSDTAADKYSVGRGSERTSSLRAVSQERMGTPTTITTTKKLATRSGNIELSPPREVFEPAGGALAE